jgi:carbon monoxide dehydrogenase subunit G
VNLEYSGREEIPTGLDAVWAFVTDPTRVASCVPDMVESTVVDAHAADAVVQVAVGPVRGKLKLRITLDPDAAAHRMNMKISGGGFGSVVDVTAGADITAVSATSTALDWKATVTMRGPVATVGGRVIDAQAKRVITQTFENVKVRLTGAPAPAS